MSETYGAAAKARLLSPEKHPGLATRDVNERRLLLCRYPTFTAYVSWAIFQTTQATWVRRLVWSRDEIIGCTGLQNSVPEIYGAEAIIEPAQVQALFDAIGAVTLRPFEARSPGIGLDGVCYHLAIYNIHYSCQLDWWDACMPDSWLPLLEWAEQAIDVFERALPQSSCRL